jgi:hypothetical protein
MVKNEKELTAAKNAIKEIRIPMFTSCSFLLVTAPPEMVNDAMRAAKAPNTYVRGSVSGSVNYFSSWRPPKVIPIIPMKHTAIDTYSFL